MRNSSVSIPPGIFIRIYNKLYKFYGPQDWWPARSRFEVIVGAILTQNTAWTNVERAIRNLRAQGYLTSPRKICALDARELSRIIRPAGYHNVKAQRLKNFTDFLLNHYACRLDRLSRIPTDGLRGELLGVNGIGPETCDSILLYAFERPVFVVDAYTKRIFSRHGFFNQESTYEFVQGLFMKNLPTESILFNEYHALIVRLAKEYCRKSPRCGDCPLKISCKRQGVII